jgi:ABC-2 type transport system ATP-binding protein
MPAIEILGFQKIYRVGFWRKTEKVGLKPLFLEVQQGEVFGFLGPNGAGKTTTLKLLMGLIFPTAGTALILAKDWRDPEVRKRIGFLPEQPYFYDQLTARELLDYYGSLSGLPRSGRGERISRMLERVGLAESGDVQLRKFSKGMLQRVGIAQAILHDPDVVFLDEPMSGLDPLGRKEVRDLIQSLKQEGKTVFFSTHILSDAEALCDRIAVLHKGELRGTGAVAELVSRASSRVEIIWQGEEALSAIRTLGAKCNQAGELFRAELDESALPRALDTLRTSNAKLISVNPVRTSLEDYFLERLKQPEAEVSR